MFSPAKAITAGALVFALGGVLLIAQPFDRQGGSVPGAARSDEVTDPVDVTGSFSALDSAPDAVYFTSTPGPVEQTPGRFDERDDVYRHRDSVLTGVGEFSDPRLSGASTVIFNVDVDPSTGQGIMCGTIKLENDDGTWEGAYTGMEFETSDGDFFTSSGWLSGSGSYAGYSAYIQTTANQGGAGTGTTHGVVFKGQPPLVEPAAE